MNRSKRAISKKNSPIEKAKQLLHPSNLIDQLPCREKEFDDIFNFVKSSLLEQVGGCMFISGVPGTGKTATVQCVLRKLIQDDQLAPIKKSIKILEINALKFSEANQFYSHLYYKLFGKKLGKQTAIQELEDHFQNPNPRHPFIVLLVDELDQLCTRKQNILYHLFDWPNRPGSRAIILSIANTMDLPERIMMTKIQSRLGLRRLTFQSYRWQQLVEIVKWRLKDCKHKIFFDEAIEFISRKVASVTGDARRVLDLCRRALDIAEKEAGVMIKPDQFSVTLKHANSAIKEVFQTDKVFAISNCSEQEKILLRALSQEYRVSGDEIAFFKNVFSHHVEMCRFDKVYVPTIQEMIDIAYSLYCRRLILIERNKLDIKSKLSLNVSVDELDSILSQ